MKKVDESRNAVSERIVEKAEESTNEKTPASFEADGASQDFNQPKFKLEDVNMDCNTAEQSIQTESSQTITTEREKPKLPGSLDLSRLRMTQDFGAQAGVKKKVLTIPVRKPNRQEFVRVHPEDKYAFQTAILELKDDSEIFVVDPSLWSELEGEIVPKILLTTINRQGVLTLWPIKLPDPDGRIDNWNHSAMQAALIAKKEWVRVAANRSLGAYDVFSATGELSEPEWPDLTLQKIMDIAFRDKLINDLEHPAIRRLLGQV